MVRINLFLLVCCVVAYSTCAVGQVVNASDNSQVGTDSQAESGKVFVAFRMRDWKAKHIHDAKQLEAFIGTLKQLGCEVKTASHNGHTDVSCRTVIWKSLSLDSHDQAHQWVTWLQQAGFETLHAHPVGDSASASSQGKTREAVQYRCPQWITKHVHQPAELGQLLAMYRGLGCEFEVNSHGGHSDVKLRCPDWMEIDVVSHKAAAAWQKYLQEMGFEAKHEH